MKRAYEKPTLVKGPMLQAVTADCKGKPGERARAARVETFLNPAGVSCSGSHAQSGAAVVPSKPTSKLLTSASLLEGTLTSRKGYVSVLRSAC